MLHMDNKFNHYREIIETETPAVILAILSLAGTDSGLPST